MRKRGRKRPIVKRTRQRPIRVKKPDNMDRFHHFMIGAFFICTLYNFQIFRKLDLSIFQLIQFYCLFIGLSFLIPIKLYRKQLTMSFYEYIIFNILTFAPVFISFIFYFNVTFKGKTYLETYPIENYEHTEFNTVYSLKDNIYEDKEYLRSVSQYDDVEVMGNEALSIYFSDGLFGIRIIEKKTLH